MNSKFNLKSIYSISLLFIILITNSACSSRTRYPVEAYNAYRLEQQKEARDEAITSIPEWFEEAEPYSPQGVSGKGTAISTDLQAAIDHALLNAQVALAGEVNAVVSEQIKRLRHSVSNDYEVHELISTTSDRYIPETNVSGARIIKQRVVAEGNGFRAYILIYLNKPLHEINKIAKASIDRAHQELLKRNDRYRKKIEREQETRDEMESFYDEP